MTAAIRVAGLTHRYGRHEALRGVSFEVPAGAVYALLGPNGAGKTTLLRAVAGLLRPTSGTAWLLGQDAARLTAADRMRIGYVAEGQPLPGGMRLGELERYLAPLHDGWDHAVADALRARFRLDATRRIRAMSRGEQMKAALLVSLAPRPELLLMDEPFTGMDPLVKDELVRGLLGSVAGSGTTVLIASHDLSELEALADHVGFLDDGRMLLSGSMDSVRARFRHVELLAGDAVTMPYVPAGALAVERSGRRTTFMLPDDDGTAEGELRARNLGADRIELRPATLRELFVALARAQDDAGAAASGFVTHDAATAGSLSGGTDLRDGGRS